MTTRLVAVETSIPDDLSRQLRIRQHRIETGTLDLGLEFHPDAADVAARMRAQITPTTFDIVRQWLNDLAVGGLAPQSGDIDPLARGVFMACDELPSSVWNDATLRQALQTFKWFPKPAEVFALLKPEADKVLDVIRGLEAIAKAPHGERAVPAREAYKLPSVPDWIGLKRGRGDHSTTRLWTPAPPARTPAEQIAILNGKAG